MISRAHRRDSLPPLEEWMRECRQLFPRHEVPPEARYPGTCWESEVRLLHWVSRYNFAVKLTELSMERGGDRALMEEAVSLLDGVVSKFEGLPPTSYKALANALMMLEVFRPELHHRALQAWQEYAQRAEDEDPDLPRIRELLPRLVEAPEEE
jgi:hypothetical protein